MIATATLENWIDNRVENTHDNYTIVTGEVYNDTKNRFPDGILIHTSYVVSGDLLEGSTITTRNSTYLLGKRLNTDVLKVSLKEYNLQ